MKNLFSPLVRRLLPQESNLYYWLRDTFKSRGPILQRVNAASKQQDRFIFIQIGANDGATFDPLREFVKRDKWEGVLVEPVAYLFERLQRNYHSAHQGLYFENVAVAAERGSRSFFYLKDYSEDPSKPAWLDQIGSFDRNQLKWAEAKYDVEVLQMEVPCLTVHDLVKKYQFPHLDLIHIDTEGYDYEIIKSINFRDISPRMIYYEHRHLTAENREACRLFLYDLGYQIKEETYDTLAYQI